VSPLADGFSVSEVMFSQAIFSSSSGDAGTVVTRGLLCTASGFGLGGAGIFMAATRGVGGGGVAILSGGLPGSGADLGGGVALVGLLTTGVEEGPFVT